MSNVSSQKAEFTGLRGILWPIHNYELKKFLPMCIMMMCILFNYTIVRDLKDTLVVNAPCSSNEVISVLKLWFVLPSAVLFMIFFMKMANLVTREKLFYYTLVPFLVFFASFAIIIYPNTDILHASTSTIKAWQTKFPNFHWFLPAMGNWSYSAFFIFAELWGSVVLSMLFWQFANQITRVVESKRFYGMYGMLGNLGAFASGQVLIYSSKYAKTLPSNIDSFYVNLKYITLAFTICGLITVFTYYWMNRNVLTDPKLYQPEEGVKKKSKLKMGILESFKFIVSNPYLMLIAVLVLSYGLTINLAEGVWKGQLKDYFKGDKNSYNQYMGGLSSWTGVITIFLMVIGNNILRRLSWITAAIVTPTMMLITSSIFFFVVWKGNISDPFSPFMGTTIIFFSMTIGLIQNVLTKGTKYSLFDSTKQMAYIPLDPEMKTKGQAAVEVIGGRAGKSSGAFVYSILFLIVGGGVRTKDLIYIIAPIFTIATVLWIVSVLNLSKKFEKLKAEKSEA